MAFHSLWTKVDAQFTLVVLCTIQMEIKLIDQDEPTSLIIGKWWVGQSLDSKIFMTSFFHQNFKSISKLVLIHIIAHFEMIRLLQQITYGKYP